MKLQHSLWLAARYLAGHLRRYAYLLLTIALGFAVITLVTGIGDGMKQAVFRVARQHYGGDLFVTGYKALPDGRSFQLLADPAQIEDLLAKAGVQPDLVVRRSNYFREATLFFAGNGIRQKNVFGVDWGHERPVLASLDFVAGGMEGLSHGDDSILLSEPAAAKLKASLGDDLVMQVNTITGQRNTARFVVRGIFRDASVFGYYKSYVDRRRLNQLINIDEASSSTVGLFYSDPARRARDAERIAPLLAAALPTGPRIADKGALAAFLDHGLSQQEIRHVVVLLDVYVSQVAELLSALDLVAYFLYVMIALIVFASIMVTYRLILRERMAETATVRALGIPRASATRVVVLESAMLCLCGIGAGWLLAIVGSGLIGLQSFAWVPGIEVFLVRGRLQPDFGLVRALVNMALLALATVPAVFVQSRAANRQEISAHLAPPSA